MTPERWKRIEELYHEARARPPADRAAFLAEACSDDEAMRRNVESLLDDSDSDDGFLAEPALAMPAQMVTDFVPATMAGAIPRRISAAGAARRGWHGRGVPGARREARARRRDQNPAACVHEQPGSPRALRARGADARLAESSQHLRDLRLRGSGRHSLPDSRARRGRNARGQARGRVESAREGVGDCRSMQVLDIARQIAEALEVAHDKGIIHRDLKPANIKITPDGVVKVLDFGLAKAVGGEGASPDLSNAPPDHGGRREGAVIGTAAYMSPEQARGLPVDKRTDIWAFGCVIYEMLTGRVTFAGDTVSDSIAKILEREPDWSALPAATPAPIRRLLLRCLTKDPKQRLRDIGDVRIEIDAIDEVLPGATATQVPLARARSRTTWLPWVALAVLAVGRRHVGGPDVRQRPWRRTRSPTPRSRASRIGRARKSMPKSRPTAGSWPSSPTGLDSSTSG